MLFSILHAGNGFRCLLRPFCAMSPRVLPRAAVYSAEVGDAHSLIPLTHDSCIAQEALTVSETLAPKAGDEVCKVGLGFPNSRNLCTMFVLNIIP